MKTVRSSVLYRIAALLFAVLFLLPILPRRYAPDAADAEAAVSESAVPALRSGGSGSGLVSEGEAYQYVLAELLKRRTKTDGEGRLCSEVSVRDYRLSEDYVRNQLCPLLFYSEAELFFLDTRGFSWTTSGGEVQSLIFHYADGVDAEIAATMLAEFRDLTAAIVAGADPSWSEWEKIAYVHDYIALHYGYDQRALSEETKDLAVYDAYRMLKEGIGVCQAYSLLTRYLLKRLGVACECVSCHELNHEWNLVKIGGSWYHVDVTWDDWDDKGLYGQVSHAYFLSSDAAFDDGGHHSNSGWSSPAPATNGKYDGFFSDVTTPFVFAPGAIYAINGDKLVKYDPDEEEFENLLTLNLEWTVSHGFFGLGGSRWNGFYAGLVYLNGKLYWNGSKKIYSYDPVTRESPLMIYEYRTSPGSKNLIFGLRAKTDDSAVRFTLSVMSDPNSGEITEKVYVAGGYIITWNVAGKSYETVCLPGETPHCDETLLALPSDVFDYTFLQWEGYPGGLPAATRDATYTAAFRMDRNDADLSALTLRDQYYLLRAARRTAPYADEGYPEAGDRLAELNALLSAFADRTDAVNAAFSAVLFGED